MNKNRKQIEDKKPKKAPLVYINRVEMKELDENNEYEFLPDIIDKDGNVINRDDLSEDDKKKYDKAVTRKISHDKRKHMILTAESELIRIIRFLSKEDEVSKRKTKGSRINRDYVGNMLSLKVGRSYTKYRDKMKASKGIITYNGKKYKRIIVSSSHSRTQKAMLVAENIWDKAMDILLCGIDPNIEYKFMSKWNSYIGLAATDSIPVSMPNIVVVDDKEILMKAKVDVVREVDTWDKKGNIQRKFSVLYDKVKRIPTNLFDGAGIVTVKKAEEWSKELNLDYIPASFQFRCIPCLKGKLYTMPIEEFAKTYNVSKIIDINGKEWDLFTDKIDCILTKSQFKFHDIYESVEAWRKEFDREVHGYKRTFNISEYDVAFSELEDATVMAYQPLQTLTFSEDGIKRLCNPTVKNYVAACKSVEGFLKFRGVCSEDDKEDDIEWLEYPPYYYAMYYNHSLFNDGFIKKKMKQDLKSAKERAYVGKITVKGNYQTLTPDLFALMQHIFGLPVTGLLKYNQIYSNYWNHHLEGTPWVDIIRSPHIAQEHSPVQVVTSGAMEKWFVYQKTGIVIGVFGNTVALKANSADFDGDHVLTVDSPVICEAAIKQFSNTIYHEKTEYPYVKGKKKNNIVVSNMDETIECDYKGYKNNIGNVINPISVLWSVGGSGEVQDFIKVMSIVGSITIDYAKHGEEADIPKCILMLLKKHQKPYFMKYLRSGKKKRSQEKELKAVGELVGSDIETELFDNTDCTMNRICHHMEGQIGSIDMDINIEEEFHWERLIASLPDITSYRYKKVRDKLIEMQEWLYEINNAKYCNTEDTNDSVQEYNKNYDLLYEYAKAELLAIVRDEAELLDMLITIYYSDKKFMEKYNDKTVLWGCFGEQLIERSKCNFSYLSNSDMDRLLKRGGKAKKHLEDLKEYREKNFQIWEFENEKNVDREVTLYKEDIQWIKKSIPTKTERCTDCRRLMLVLAYICRKCDIDAISIIHNKNNRITKSALCKLADIDRRYFDEDIKILAELCLLDISVDKYNHLTLKNVQMNMDCNEILFTDIHYRKLAGVMRDKIRKSEKSVKKDCA
ncbi:hypothetical protein V1226_09645 [Lachnospiraceae bacterium JLR.KK009]|nr:hypothetical protein C810_01743 [Lachnospiraceae bacterium A2]